MQRDPANVIRHIAVLLAVASLAGCAGDAALRPVPAQAPVAATPVPDRLYDIKLLAPPPAPRCVETAAVEEGVASWYGAKYHGRATASGEIFDMHALTAAHRRLPFGTRLRVTNLDNGRSVVVTVNDRGPTIRRRIIDLSHRAAADLDMVERGIAPVRIAELRCG